MQTLKNIKNQPPLSPTILTFLIHFPEFQLLTIFLVNQQIPFYEKIVNFLRIDLQAALEILVIGQLCTRTFLVATLMLRHFVLKGKKSSIEILVLKFLKVKLKILIVISLYWNIKACKYCLIHFIVIAIFNIIVTIGELIGTRILNSSFRFQEENLICQKNTSLVQPLLIFPIMYILNFYDLFYAACLIGLRCFFQLYENFNNVQNRAIQYCDYFSPLIMFSFCLIEIISRLLGIQLLNNQNPLFFIFILAFAIYGSNNLAETLILLVPKYHLSKCAYFTKNQDKPSLLQTEGNMHVSESEQKQFILALRILAKVYITKQKMEGEYVIKENPYFESQISQDQFDIFWQEFNKIIINHRVYCSNVRCPCFRRTHNEKQGSQISSALFMEIMFSSLQKVLISTNSTKLAIIEKYFYLELLQMPIKNYFLLVRLKNIVKKSEEILQVDLLMDETRQMLGHLLIKGKAQNQHIEIDELINFQINIKKMKKQFILLSSEYKQFYDLFYNSFVDMILLKQSTKNLIDLKKEFKKQVDEHMPKFSRNLQFLSYCFIYYSYFFEYTEDVQKIKTKITNILEFNQLDAQNAGNNKNKFSKSIDVFDPMYGAIKIDLVWKPGEVISITKNICQLFGFKMDEVQGNKVNKLMPAIFSRYHDRYLNRFVENGSLAMLRCKEKIFFARNAKKFIFPIVIRLKLQYKCGLSFSASSLVRKTAKKSEFILLNNYGKIEQISQNLYGLLFKKSLKEEISKIKRINVYKMLLSLNHFVKHPNEMDDRIYEGIITTVEEEQLLQSFYKNIELINGLNGQQFSSVNATYSNEGDERSQGSKGSLSAKSLSIAGQQLENIPPPQSNYEVDKCWANMKQMLRDFYSRVDIDKIKAYRVVYRFYDLVTSEFTCKVLEIVSVKEQVSSNTLKAQLPKQMIEIGDLYGLVKEDLNKIRKIQANEAANCHLNSLIGSLIKQGGNDQNFKFGEQDSFDGSQSLMKRKEQNLTGNQNNQKAGSIGSSMTLNGQKNILKSSIISSFSLGTIINQSMEWILTGSMLLAAIFLIVICLLSTTIKHDYGKLQKDNSIMNNFIMNFESELAIEELYNFYHVFNLDIPTSLVSEKNVLTKNMKSQLINLISDSDNEISDEFFSSSLRLINSRYKVEEIKPTIAILNEIYTIFLMTENKAEYLGENYYAIRNHLSSIANQQKELILQTSQSFRFKIDAIVSTYGFSLVILVAFMVLINRESMENEQKIIDFLPFINKNQVLCRINFFKNLMEYMKQNQEISYSIIERIEASSSPDYIPKTTVVKQIKKKKNGQKPLKEKESNDLDDRKNPVLHKQNTVDLRSTRIIKGESKKLTWKNSFFMLLLIIICLAVIVQTDYSFMEAHNKFKAYINLKESVSMLENLTPRTLLTYLINMGKIINSQKLIDFPNYYYDAPTSELFNMRLNLARSDNNDTELANTLNQNLNTLICSLVQCNPTDTIPQHLDVYFLTYRFINTLEYLRKFWPILKTSTQPKEDIRKWIQEGNIEELLKSLEQILELIRKNQLQISQLFTQQINLIGYQLLYFSLTLIPLLIISMYFLRRKFVMFVHERIESIEDIYKQFSWQLLSENTYALNYFESKLRIAKKY